MILRFNIIAQNITYENKVKFTKNKNSHVYRDLRIILTLNLLLSKYSTFVRQKRKIHVYTIVNAKGTTFYDITDKSMI